jgi:hypothetical protein
MNVLCLSLQRSAQGDAKHRGSVFGVCKIGELTSQEIAAWRMELSPGLPLRADPGTSAGAPPSRGVRNDRQQSGEGLGRQPVTEAEGAAPFGSWAELEAIVGPSPGGPAEFPKTEASVRAVPGNHAAVPVVARMWADTASATLAFSERVHERTRRQPEIYIMNADGSNQTNVSHDPVEDTSPSWVPARR